MRLSVSGRRGQSQAILLIVLALIMVALFAVVTLLVSAYGRLQSRLGTQWYARGIADLRAGQAERAVLDLRTALSYSRDASYRLELARALVAAGRTNEAREYLLSLWERQPGAAELNLELARVAALSDALPAAIGYYENAIYGAWDSSAEQNRRNTRLELARFLLKHNEKPRARAVLMTLASELPHDPALHTEVGNMLLSAGDPETARLQFEDALRDRRNYPEALEGAGLAAFATNDFVAAQRYLEAYVRSQPGDEKAQSVLSVARTALEIDPLRPRLSSAERRARLLRLFDDAQQRVSQCVAQLGSPMPQPDLQAALTKLASQSVNASDKALRRDPDLVYDLFDVASSTLNAATKWCGPRHPTDDAVAAIAQLHGVSP